MKNKKLMITFKNKQRGATLFTSLVFLTLMTIVSVSAAKIASIDTIIAGNHQQQMLVFQQTSKTLKGFANPVAVVTAIQDNDGIDEDWTKTLEASGDGSTSPHAVREIKNRGIEYPCQAEGQATSVGSDTAAQCFVFDLRAEDRLTSYGLVDKHFRGVGKALPNTSNYK